MYFFSVYHITQNVSTYLYVESEHIDILFTYVHIYIHMIRMSHIYCTAMVPN